jgi:hypothetical protein
VTKAASLELAECHLDDPFDPQGNERQVLVDVPAREAPRHPLVAVGLGLRPLPPRVIVERIHRERPQVVDQFAAELGGERGTDADMVQSPLSLAPIVVQAEQERPDTLTVLVDPKPCDRALGGAFVLDLDE